MIVCVLLPRFELAIAAGGRGALLGTLRRSRPSPVASSSWGRSPRPPRPSASIPACGWARPSPAARRCSSSRPIRSASPTHGRACSAGSRASARGSSPAVPARRASTPTGLRRLHGGHIDGVSRAAVRAGPRGGGRRRRAHRPGAVAVRRDGRRRAGPRAPPGQVTGARRSRAHARRAAAQAGDDGGAPGAARAARHRHARASSRRCRAPRWPTASAPPGSSRTISRAGGDTPLRPRSAAERSRSRSSCPSRPRARSSSGRSPCSSTACWPAASGAGGRCARSRSAARLVEGGTWRERVVFREPLADPRAHAARARRRGWRRCPRRPRRCGCASSASARRGRPALAVRRRRRAARARACARRSARRAPPPGRRPRCACSRSIPARACPSGAPCSTPFQR